MQILYTMRRAPTQPPKIESDEVFPMYFLDHGMSTRRVILCHTMLFNSVLDATKLHDGLLRLVSKGDWRKLGGRLRRTPDGRLEIHVPKEFTKERPAVRYSAETLDMPISEHPLACRFPKAGVEGGSPTMYAGPLEFKELSILPGGHTGHDDYFSTDQPLLGLRVIAFADATIVTLVVPHDIAGAHGLQSLLAAWSAAVRNGDDGNYAIPPLLGARQNVLDPIVDGEEDGQKPAPPYVLAPREIKGWHLVKFVFRLLWTMFWRPKVEGRSIWLPHQFVSRLRQQCIQEVEEANKLSGKGDGKPVFLSDGDVLTAWTASFVIRVRGGKRPVLALNAADVASRFKNLRDNKGEGVYVQNLTGGVFTDIGADVVMRRPLGEVAQVVRASIQEQVSEEQALAQMRMYKSWPIGQRDSVFGNPDGHLLVYTNWSKFDLFNTCDFGPAVVVKPNNNNNTTTTTPPGKPVYLHCVPTDDNPFHRDSFLITGKDVQGNYWICALLYPEEFGPFEKYIEQTWQRIK